MNSTTNKLKTRTAEVFMDEKEILYIRTFKNANVDFNDAVDTFLLAKKISMGKPQRILADLRQKKKVDSKAMKLFTKFNTPHNQKAKAILINSNFNKILNNLLLVKKSKYPVKTFTSELEALQWLNSFS